MGGPGFEVETADMDLLGQVFTRQQQHMSAIGSYVEGSCSASGAFTGVMSLLQGHYTPAHRTVVTGYGQGADIAEACHGKIVATRTDVVAADRRSYEQMRRLHPDLPPYSPPPGGGTLGPAGQTVPSTSDDPSAWEKFQEAVEQGKRPLESAGAIAGHDPGDAMGNQRNAAERHVDDYTNPSSWVRRGVDKAYDSAVDRYYDHRAESDPFGRSGSDLRLQSANRSYYDYESARASGQSFARDHLPVTDPGHMPGSAWPSDSVREGVHGTAETAGQVVNIVNAVPALADSFENLHDSIDLQHDVSAAADGPANTADSDWAANSGRTDW